MINGGGDAIVFLRSNGKSIRAAYYRKSADFKIIEIDVGAESASIAIGSQLYELIQDLFRQSRMRRVRRKRQDCQASRGDCYWRRVEMKWRCRADYTNPNCGNDVKCDDSDMCLATCGKKIEWSSERKGPVRHRGHQKGKYPENDKMTEHCFPIQSRSCNVLITTTTEEIVTTTTTTTETEIETETEEIMTTEQETSPPPAAPKAPNAPVSRKYFLNLYQLFF